MSHIHIKSKIYLIIIVILYCLYMTLLINDRIFNLNTNTNENTIQFLIFFLSLLSFLLTKFKNPGKINISLPEYSILKLSNYLINYNNDMDPIDLIENSLSLFEDQLLKNNFLLNEKIKSDFFNGLCERLLKQSFKKENSNKNVSICHGHEENQNHNHDKENETVKLNMNNENTSPNPNLKCFSFVIRQRYKDSLIRYCYTCMIIKPDRAHHCKYCNLCILKLYHHCYWLDSCIGMYNIKYFLLFHVYSLISLMIFLYSHLYYLEEDSKSNQIIFLIFSILLAILIYSTFINFSCVLNDKTSYEKVYPLVYVDDIEKTNDINQNDHITDSKMKILNNIKRVFGRNPLLWLVPVNVDGFNSDGILINK